MKTILTGKEVCWWFPMLTVLGLLFGFYIHNESLSGDIAYLNKNDQLLVKFRDKFNEAQKNHDEELQKILVNGFVEINLKADADYLDGMKDFKRVSKEFFFGLVTVNTLYIVGVLIKNRKTPSSD